jgi:electron transfer flavoprotein alpha/beta subunit
LDYAGGNGRRIAIWLAGYSPTRSMFVLGAYGVDTFRLISDTQHTTPSTKELQRLLARVLEKEQPNCIFGYYSTSA